MHPFFCGASFCSRSSSRRNRGSRSLPWRPSMRSSGRRSWPLESPPPLRYPSWRWPVVTMIGQRLLTDNRRLLTAGERSDQLRRRAAKLPVGSPRRVGLQRAAAGIPGRVLAAGFVPLALILGPMVLMFLWFQERMDPASWNPPWERRRDRGRGVHASQRRVPHPPRHPRRRTLAVHIVSRLRTYRKDAAFSHGTGNSPETKRSYCSRRPTPLSIEYPP